MTVQSKYLKKIRDLLDLAESSNEHEAELARTQAERLMVRWSVDESMLESKAERKGKVITQNIPLKGVYATAHAQLLHCIAEGLGGSVKVLLHKSGNKTTHAICAGFEADIDRVIYIHTSLQLQANVALNRWWDVEKRSIFHGQLSASEKFRARRMFLMSFAGGVRSRMQEERRTAEGDTPGYALVLRDRSAEVDEAVNEMYPNVRKGRALKGSSLGGNEGYAAGRNANVGTRGVEA